MRQRTQDQGASEGDDDFGLDAAFGDMGDAPKKGELGRAERRILDAATPHDFFVRIDDDPSASMTRRRWWRARSDSCSGVVAQNSEQ